MNIKLFYHSLLSDWNHGNAHFLRGYATELRYRGHNVKVYEQANNWSLSNLIKDHGKFQFYEFNEYYPSLEPCFYEPEKLVLGNILSDADLVIVHEWNSPDLVRQIGEFKKDNNNFILLFHDTHHRAVTKEEEMKEYDLRYYDGVLAFGEIIKNIYLNNGWVRNAWTWHEAADTRIFLPLNKKRIEGDLAWIGNWGDDERTREITEYLIEPVKALKIKAKVFGVRYPPEAIEELNKAGIEYGGWLPNYKVPEIFARYKFTIHIPRGPYAEKLPGIPTIRPFEALACGIPLISAPWHDDENLFSPDSDFLMVKNGTDMMEKMQLILNDEKKAADMSANGIKKILKKHTCSHRIDELYAICDEIGLRLHENEKENYGF